MWIYVFLLVFNTIADTNSYQCKTNCFKGEGYAFMTPFNSNISCQPNFNKSRYLTQDMLYNFIGVNSYCLHENNTRHYSCLNSSNGYVRCNSFICSKPEDWCIQDISYDPGKKNTYVKWKNTQRDVGILIVATYSFHNASCRLSMVYICRGCREIYNKLRPLFTNCNVQIKSTHPSSWEIVSRGHEHIFYFFNFDKFGASIIDTKYVYRTIICHEFTRILYINISHINTRVYWNSSASFNPRCIPTFRVVYPLQSILTKNKSYDYGKMKNCVDICFDVNTYNEFYITKVHTLCTKWNLYFPNILNQTSFWLHPLNQTTLLLNWTTPQSSSGWCKLTNMTLVVNNTVSGKIIETQVTGSTRIYVVPRSCTLYCFFIKFCSYGTCFDSNQKCYRFLAQPGEVYHHYPDSGYSTMQNFQYYVKDVDTFPEPLYRLKLVNTYLNQTSFYNSSQPTFQVTNLLYNVIYQDFLQVFCVMDKIAHNLQYSSNGTKFYTGEIQPRAAYEQKKTKSNFQIEINLVPNPNLIGGILHYILILFDAECIDIVDHRCSTCTYNILHAQLPPGISKRYAEITDCQFAVTKRLTFSNRSRYISTIFTSTTRVTNNMSVEVLGVSAVGVYYLAIESIDV